MKPALVPAGGLLFAPMEGVTDALYRQTVVETCPGWDVLACDFLRVPSAGRYPLKHLKAHMGEGFIADPDWNARTMFQILTSERAFTVDLLKQVEELGIQWVDLNLGCPSKTVCKSGGGSSLLRDLNVVERIVTDIRKNFSGRFTCKVRTGFEDGAQLPDIIRLLNDCGAEMITVHGRTRAMMYKEPARWEWIAQAVRLSQVPVVGNGDVWSAQDARELLRQTGCHAVMVARGAMKTPWFPLHFHQGLPDTPQSRLEMTRLFLTRYADKLLASGVQESGLVRQLKCVTRYLFDELPQGAGLRRRVLLAQTSAAIFHELNEYRLNQ